MNPTESARPLGAKTAVALFAFALITSAPIWWRFAIPILDGANWSKHPGHVPTLFGHMLGGTLMIWAGAGALFIGWTGRFRRWHKWFGYTYLLGGSAGAIAALWLSAHLTHPPVSTGVATATLAVAWLAFAAMALRAARNRRFDSHREWVVRSYVLTWTFVGCRIAQMAPIFSGLGEEGVTAGIWLYWIAPILICEVVLQWRRGAPLSQGGTPDRPA